MLPSFALCTLVIRDYDCNLYHSNTENEGERGGGGMFSCCVLPHKLNRNVCGFFFSDPLLVSEYSIERFFFFSKILLSYSNILWGGPFARLGGLDDE